MADKDRDKQTEQQPGDREGRGAREETAVPSRRDRQRARLKDARHTVRAESVSEPLQRVVGDDEAPFGPPTGEVSTKVDEARKGVAERIAFADHEALDPVDEPDELLTPHGIEKSQVIHNRQNEALLAAQPDLSEEGDGDGGGTEPRAQGKPQRGAGAGTGASSSRPAA
jgi:hypothetical protein